MKISKKAYYGLRAMVALAQDFPEVLSVRALAEQEKLPEEYLEKILQKLRKARLIQAIKGHSGGYKLAKPPQDISVEAILATLDGTFSPFTCSTAHNSAIACPIQEARSASDVWTHVASTITQALESLSLRDLMRKK